MKLQRKISGKYLLKALFGFLLAILYFQRTVFPVSASNEKVISVKTDSENIYLYLKGVSEITGETVQIGNMACENVTIYGLEEVSVPLRTVILVDNSQSVQVDRRADIQEILKAVVDGRLEGEEFRIGTFSDSVTWLCGYTTDYVAVQSILDGIEYVSQETYFSDCLYGVIEEMTKNADSVYSRVIIVSDGADNQAIGYTNQEVSDLLGKCSIPVYTIGTLGDNGALETMFSFSRASKAEYYLLDGSVSKEEIIASLSEDRQLICMQIAPDSALLDGSQKSIRVVLETGEGEVTVTVSVDMPFSAPILSSGEIQQSTEESQQPTDEEQQSPEEASTVPEPTFVPPLESSIPVMGGNETPVFVFIIVGGVILFIILMVIIMLIVAGRKKARRKAEVNAAAQREAQKQQMQQMSLSSADTGNSWQTQGNTASDKTMILGGGNTGGDNTISLWDQVPTGPAATTYLMLRDNAKPATMFKVPIKDVIRIGRKDADIVIDYDKYISSKQCEIIKRGALLYIRDLGSANGTYYENVRVYDQETPIVSGGTIQMGQSKFTVTIVTE